MKYYIVVTPFFPTPEKFYGGFIYDQVNALRRRGKNILVLYPRDVRVKCADYSFDGFDVHYFPTVNLPSYILNGFTDPINRRLFKRFIARTLPAEAEVEAIHCHTSQCALYGNILKELYPEAVSIIQYHDPDPFTIHNGIWADKRWNIRYKIRKVIPKIEKFDVNVSVSDRVEENLLSFPALPPREHYRPYLDRLSKIRADQRKPVIKNPIVLINGVDLRKFPRRPVAHDNFTIGCIGNYVGWKNHVTLIDAVKHLVDGGHRDIRLRLVGNNPPEGFQRLREYVSSIGMDDYITFVPPYAHAEVGNFYNEIDLFVLPSEFEGFGCVFSEAAACGVPFISVADQGIDSLIPAEDKDKWLIRDSRNAGELAAKILQYKESRYPQPLTADYDIDRLIGDFLAKINLLKL